MRLANYRANQAPDPPFITTGPPFHSPVSRSCRTLSHARFAPLCTSLHYFAVTLPSPLQPPIPRLAICYLPSAILLSAIGYLRSAICYLRPAIGYQLSLIPKVPGQITLATSYPAGFPPLAVAPFPPLRRPRTLRQ